MLRLTDCPSNASVRRMTHDSTQKRTSPPEVSLMIDPIG